MLFWKVIVLVFGGTEHAGAVKLKLDERPQGNTNNDQPRINASPLDYHVFRQEIISKYPAFHPPKPLFPFDPENNSVLPSFSEADRGDEASDKVQNGVGQTMPNTGSSIIHQSIHIATPAPSPPPSPAGPGGKGIKKQNYQTNQNFPFLYPPLDAASNHIGGKGETALQDLFVGRKWSGSDVPASIIEAATLFAQRMHAPRAMKQLWSERVRFLQEEQSQDSAEIERLEAVSKENDSLSVLNDDHRQRLLAVESYYVRVYWETSMDRPNLHTGKLSHQDAIPHYRANESPVTNCHGFNYAARQCESCQSVTKHCNSA